MWPRSSVLERPAVEQIQLSLCSSAHLHNIRLEIVFNKASPALRQKKCWRHGRSFSLIAVGEIKGLITFDRLLSKSNSSVNFTWDKDHTFSVQEWRLWNIEKMVRPCKLEHNCNSDLFWNLLSDRVDELPSPLDALQGNYRVCPVSPNQDCFACCQSFHPLLHTGGCC